MSRLDLNVDFEEFAKSMAPLEVATRCYFWKPYMAYFSAFELNAYRRAEWVPEGVALDLGCREGVFAEMLKTTMGFEAWLTGADINRVNLKRAARKKEIYRHIVRLDASYLPFTGKSFDSVMSNAVFYCLRPDPAQATREIYRVLKDGGSFACTVPTNMANEHYMFTEVLDQLGLHQLGRWYQRRIDVRVGHVSMLTKEKWENMLSGAGFMVEKAVPYISAAISRRWSLYLEIPRILSVLQLVKAKRIRSTCAALLQRHMARPYERQVILPSEEQGDYLLIICRKPPQ